LGLEAAGLVVPTGERVAALLAGGGHAEYVAAPVGQVLPLPPRLDTLVAAGLPEAHLTAFVNLVVEARLAAGQVALVLAGASGVGLAAIRLAKHLGARVAATTRSAEKLASLRTAGADLAIRVPETDLRGAIEGVFGRDGVDVVLDPVAIGQESALRCLAYDGKLLVVGFAGGTIPAYAANRILLKGCSVIGIRAGEAGRRNPKMRQRELETLRALAAQGIARPVVSVSYPLHRYAEAMRLLERRQVIGRVALTNDGI